MTYFKVVLGLFSFLLIAFTGSAQNPAEQPSQFDLVIFGSNIDSNIEVSLKENPGIENNWQKLDSGHMISDERDKFTTLLFSNLSTEKFAGQDIRENYIAIKISTTTAATDREIRALYALPHVDYSSDARQKLHAAIQSDPGQIRKHSLANLLFPSPHFLSDGKKFTEHIEMPVRHLKPGVQEVRWLDIIFSEE